ncbi:MAG TPA: tRNA lysidine(34) synthetase TilS, partial [Mycobacteriales bacterium]|nr:tRNA lysidine(34) synthetase TilS [Mycobacteriales bacterium]
SCTGRRSRWGGGGVTGPPAATAAVRLAVRRCLADLADDAQVAAAVSGGADSLALAAGLAVERPGSSALVVDHDLQPRSREVAAAAADRCRRLGLAAEVLPETSAVPTRQGVSELQMSSRGGPEAAARALRYRLLDEAADRRGVAAVLLGHTLDDQAETVLLALARGSGARSLAGMAPVRGRYRRPLLGLDRVTVRQACAEAGLQPVDDPHNADAAFARARVRHDVLPAVERALGPGVAAALARTADLLRADADALDALTPDLPAEPDCAELLALPVALRSRALKRWAEAACGQAVGSAHVAALRALVEHWRGQGPVALPGGAAVGRTGGRLVARR